MDATNKGVGRWEGGGEGGWVNDALRHRRPSCVQWARQMATAALTIP